MNTHSIEEARDVSALVRGALADECPLLARLPRRESPPEFTLETACGPVTQWAQTFQAAIRPEGETEKIYGPSARWRPPEKDGGFGRDAWIAFTEFARNVENSLYYSRGCPARAPADRDRTRGLRELIGLGGNRRTVGLAGATIEAAVGLAVESGGAPDVLVISAPIMGEIARRVTRIEGADCGGQGGRFGVTCGGRTLSVFPGLRLRGRTVVALTWSDMALHYTRPETYCPRECPDGRFVADVVGDFAIGLKNPGHHAWLECD